MKRASFITACWRFRGPANRVATARAIMNLGLIFRCSRTLWAVWPFNMAFAGRPRMHVLIERALGWDLLTFRGTEPWINPMQARFIINRDERIAFAEIAFNYEERTDPANLVPLLVQRRHGYN